MRYILLAAFLAYSLPAWSDESRSKPIGWFSHDISQFCAPPDASAFRLCGIYIANLIFELERARLVAYLKPNEEGDPRLTNQSAFGNCRPTNASYWEMSFKVLDYAGGHPESHNMPDGALVLEALKKAYPCQ